jgi:Tfp pilus assembly protein PilN
MKPVRLQFGPPAAALRQHLLGHVPSPYAPIAILVLIAALAWGTALARQTWNADEELAQTRASLAALQRHKGQRADRAAESAKPQITAQQRQAWSQIARQLNTPWGSLLDTLEGGTPDSVALVSIEPDARVGSVRLQVEAKALDTLLAYARELGALPLLESVTLVKHETNEQDSNKPVRLSLDLRLKTRPAQRPGEEPAR